MQTENKSISDFDANSQFINGPINVARMEGQVESTKKVIYILMDYHMDVDRQTKCSNVFSEDLNTFLAKSFHNLNKGEKVCDFFFEIYPSHRNLYGPYSSLTTNYRGRYIDEIARLFRKLFKYDKNNNKVSISDIFTNVRLHYFDIRSYLSFRIMHIYSVINEIKYFIPDINRYQQLVQLFGEVLSIMEKLENVINDNFNKPIKKLPKGHTVITVDNPSETDFNQIPMDWEMIDYLINKLLNSYKNKDIQKKINICIKKITLPKIKTCIILLKKTIDALQKSINHMQVNLNTIVVAESNPYPEFRTFATNHIDLFQIRKNMSDAVINGDYYSHAMISEILVEIIDFFALRRILDKDYVKNAIIYSGAMHSFTYIYYLLNDYGFDITHFSFNSIGDLATLRKDLPKVPIEKYEKIWVPGDVKQCSNLSTFPKNFD